MARLVVMLAVVSLVGAPAAYSQKKVKVKPDINESKEFKNVFHSPSAAKTPEVFRSILQMELVVKQGDTEAKVQYANGTVVSKDGLIVSVVSEPSKNANETAGIQSATVLFLDGSGAEAKLVGFEPAYGIAVFRVKGLEAQPLRLSKAPIVAERRMNWHAIYRRGPRTFLYRRPLQVHKASHEIAETKDLCQIIDRGSSALSADRSGSALIAPDGTLAGLMGFQKSWKVTPKNQRPRKKLAWAVPASAIARLLDKSS